MNRRRFISSSLRAAAVGSLATGSSALADRVMSLSAASFAASYADPPLRRELDLNRHRFGVNYTPSKNWWFCWNEWDADSIKRDLDGIASLGADHLRILLIWPYFQPNPRWVSPLV